MKSCDQLRDRSNPIGTISDYYWSRIPWDWLSHQSPDYLTFWINLPTFRSTFWINLLNQPTQSVFSLNWRRHWLVVRCFLWQTYVRRIVLLPTEVHMIQVIDLHVDHQLVETWSVSPSSTPWWQCRWKPCWTQLGLFPCANVSFVFKKVRTTRMMKASW